MPNRKVNSFEMKTESGKQIWYWRDSAGSQCGTDRSWKYLVQIGDQVNENVGKCPDGKIISEVTISGSPTRL